MHNSFGWSVTDSNLYWLEYDYQIMALSLHYVHQTSISNDQGKRKSRTNY